MLCQYPRCDPVSSEKHETAADAGVEEEGCPRRRGDRHGGGYRALLESLTVSTLMTNPMNVLRSRTPARLYVYDTLLEALAEHLEHMAAKFGEFIQKEHAVVRQRHFTRHGDVATADQSCIRDGMVGRATRAGRDQGRPVAGAASDAMDAGGLNGFGQGHPR
jgi:hypothetical protein